jgi:hypothetical protein
MNIIHVDVSYHIVVDAFDGWWMGWMDSWRVGGC